MAIYSGTFVFYERLASAKLNNLASALNSHIHDGISGNQIGFSNLSGTIAGGQIPSDTITGDMIADNTVTTANLVDASSYENLVVQVVNFQTGAYDSGSTAMPYDDSKPEITEGNEFLTLAITPTSASNKLLIEVNITLGHSTDARTLIAALFETTTDATYALAVVSDWKDRHEDLLQLSLRHYMTAPGTSEYTFRVRAGTPQTGNTEMNGTDGSRMFGGACISSITLTEILV